MRKKIGKKRCRGKKEYRAGRRENNDGGRKRKGKRRRKVATEKTDRVDEGRGEKSVQCGEWGRY